MNSLTLTRVGEHNLIEITKLKDIARTVGVSPAYLSQIRHGVRPASEEIKQKLSNLGIEIKQIKRLPTLPTRHDSTLDVNSVTTYNYSQVGANKSRWASRTSNPSGGIFDVFGGFDPHALPPGFKKY